MQAASAVVYHDPSLHERELQQLQTQLEASQAQQAPRQQAAYSTQQDRLAAAGAGGCTGRSLKSSPDMPSSSGRCCSSKELGEQSAKQTAKQIAKRTVSESATCEADPAQSTTHTVQLPGHSQIISPSNLLQISCRCWWRGVGAVLGPGAL